MRKIQILRNKPFYLSLSLLDLSKAGMIYVKSGKKLYGEIEKLCYIDNDSFIFHAKTNI